MLVIFERQAKLLLLKCRQIIGHFWTTPVTNPICFISFWPE